MSYAQNAREDRKTRRQAGLAIGQAQTGAIAYFVFAVAFVFTAAVVLGLVP